MEEIVTGEAVVLDLPCARFPTRILAFLIDMLTQAAIFTVVAFLVGLGAVTNVLDQASATAVILTGFVLVIVGYPATFESLSRGRTLGKLALGLRVVADDGGPERFRQAFVRALAGAVECWITAGVPALITSMISGRGKRLGDIFAGTFVVRERTPRPAALPYPAYPGPAWQAMAQPPGFHGAGGPQRQAAPPAVAGQGPPWAAALDLSGLPDALAASASSYLSRYSQLNEAARDHLGRQLAADIAARVSPPPPPGIPAVTYLYAVLAERRNREFARLARPAGPVMPAYPQPPAYPQAVFQPPPQSPPQSPPQVPPQVPPPATTTRPTAPRGTTFAPPE